MNGGVQIPGPGSAMALFAAVAIYTAGFANVDWEFRVVFLIFAFGGLLATVFIEWLHTSNGETVDEADEEYNFAAIRFWGRE